MSETLIEQGMAIPDPGPHPLQNRDMAVLAGLCAGGIGAVCVPGADLPFYRMLARMGVVVFDREDVLITRRTIRTVDEWLERTTLISPDGSMPTEEDLQMFEVIDRKWKPARAAVGGAEIAVNVRVGVKGSGYLACFFIGAGVAKRLGWDEETRVSIAWGRDSDLGKVKISQWKEGSVWLVRKGNKYCTVFKIHTGTLPDTTRGPVERENVHYEVLPGTATGGSSFVVISLPKTFHARKAA